MSETTNERQTKFLFWFRRVNHFNSNLQLSIKNSIIILGRKIKIKNNLAKNMRQIQKFFSILIISLILASFLTPASVFADGMVINPNPYSDRWDYGDQTNQQTFINYEAGLEKMILSIGIKEADKNAVWIFPVTADPDKVVIDIVTKLPQLGGEEITKKAKSNLFFTKKALVATQIYTIPFIDWWGRGVYKAPAEGIFAPMGIGPEIETDVIVHEHLEKEGITTEIITAKTAQALYDYLKNKDLKIDKGSIPVLDTYIGKEFTFVVSWVSGEVIPAEQRGVFVTFPTKNIYYPLLLTSVYGSKVVPITIRVIGYVSPKIFKDIKDYTKVSYYFDKKTSYFTEIRFGGYGGYSLSEMESIANFYGQRAEIEKDYRSMTIKNVKYTKVEIDAPSKMFTDDLWISPRTPLKASYTSFLANHPVINGVILLIICSILTGILAGLTVFKESRNKRGIRKYGLLGLFNVLSIIGLIIATIFSRTKEVKEEDKELFEELKGKGYSTWAFEWKDLRKLEFVPIFSVYFLIISWIVIEILKLGLS